MSSSQSISLDALGWKPYFQQQLSLEQWETSAPMRVFEVHRAHVVAVGARGSARFDIASGLRGAVRDTALAVGDWLLVDRATGTVSQVLQRSSLFQRVRPGTKAGAQLIAANVDTAFIVTSCNEEFKLSRIERYVALAREARTGPVVVLTKSDVCNQPSVYLDRVGRADSSIVAVAINALDADSVAALRDWLEPGQTIALLGSSGTGKSTLLNTLLGVEVQSTGSVRASDQRGRHTTTARTLHLLPSGAVVLDTPGMRELQLSEADRGVARAFHEIEELAAACRFHDCRHEFEPGCAVIAALAAGTLEPRRLANYHKLRDEQLRHAETLAERRQRLRDIGKLYKGVQAATRRRKQGR